MCSNDARRRFAHYSSGFRPLAKTALATLVLAAIAAGPAAAATSTGSMTVRATVAASCTFASAAMDFGTYTSGQATDLKVDGSIGYTNCNVASFTIELNGGGSGAPTARRMTTTGGAALNYQLYKDTARANVWVQGAGSRTVTLATPGSGTVPVYGTIPAAQNVAAGTYTDTVVVTMNF